MIKPVKLIVVAMILAATAQAQNGGQGRANGAGPIAIIQRYRQIVADLNLTSDQQSKIDAILASARQDVANFRSQIQGMSVEERLEKIRNFAADVRSKIETELTTEQKTTFDEKLAEARAEAGAELAGTIADRLKSSLDSLDLTDGQREKADALVAEMTDKFKSLASEPDTTKRQAATRDAIQNMREQLAEFLTDQQQEAFREKMQQSELVNRPARRAVAATTAPAPATQPMAMMQAENPAAKPAPVPDAAKPAPIAEPAKPGVSAGTPIEPGKPAPPFDLLRLDGQRVQLSSFKGRVVVLVFGSYTCPTFRDRAAGLNKLFHDVQGKVSMFMIYTSEAHPVNGWDVDRNARDNIVVQQPTTDIDRRAVARKAHDALHLAMPVLMDGMNNAVTTEYGTFPNGAVVINGDGIVVSSQQWAEPMSLRHMIDEVSGDKLP